MEDAYWKRLGNQARPTHFKHTAGGNAGSSAYETPDRWVPSPAARSREARARTRAFIVYTPFDWGTLPDAIKITGADIRALLITDAGELLYEHVCSHPHYAYGDLWSTRPTRIHDHPELSVDPHAYSLEEFQARYPELAREAGRHFE